VIDTSTDCLKKSSTFYAHLKQRRRGEGLQATLIDIGSRELVLNSSSLPIIDEAFPSSAVFILEGSFFANKHVKKLGH